MSRFSEEYELKEELGRGAFSIVRRCMRVSDGVQLAAKIVNIQKLSSREKQKLEREVRICKLLKHSNIVHLHDVVIDNGYHYMVFDLITGGELFDEVVAREFYSERDASRCLQEVLNAISFCHRSCIVHRDLKPENLLLSSKSKDAITKLADFGLAVELSNPNEVDWFGYAGTPGYLSPEVVNKEKYGKAIDVWACGVILYILLVGYPPFWDEDQKKLYHQIKTAKYDFPSPEWDTVSHDAKGLIKMMLEIDPSHRVTADDALKHPWIANRESVVPGFHRQNTIDGIKRFLLRRKFKAAIYTTVFTNRFSLAKKASDPNLSSPLTPAPAGGISLGDESSSGGQESTIEEFATPKGNTPMIPEMLPLKSNGPMVGGDEPSPAKDQSDVLIKLTNDLNKAIRQRDINTFQELCDPNITYFDSKVGPVLVKGLDYHTFKFTTVATKVIENVVMVTPHVQMIGREAACVSYVRVLQILDMSGNYSTESHADTAIWKYSTTGGWKCTHYHTT